MGDVSLADVACLVGALRKSQGWALGDALAEAVDISDSVEISDMLNAINNFEPAHPSSQFNLGE